MKRISYLYARTYEIRDGETKTRLYPNCIECDDAHFDEHYAFAKNDSYNGEVTVEDIPDPVTEPTEVEQLRADVDYIAMETGVEL